MSLYNCKSDGDQYRISKFTNDLDVEASYLTDGAECDCPAGHRPVCRHRIMLPRFIAKNATAGQWFHNYEHNQWIRATVDTDEELCESLLASAASELTATEVDERIRDYRGPMPGDGLIGAIADSTMKTINLLDLARPVSPTVTTTDFDSVDNGSIPLLAANETKPLRRL